MTCYAFHVFAIVTLLAASVALGVPSPPPAVTAGVATPIDSSWPIAEATQVIESALHLSPVDILVVLSCTVPCPEAAARLTLRGHRQVVVFDPEHPLDPETLAAPTDPKKAAAFIVRFESAGPRLEISVVGPDLDRTYLFVPSSRGSRSFWGPPVRIQRGCFPDGLDLKQGIQ